MAIKSCRVSCTDASGIDDSAEVTAETLYEAVAQTKDRSITPEERNDKLEI